MKIELCLLTVNLLAGLAEVTWYLQSLPGEKKVTFYIYLRRMSVRTTSKVVFSGLTRLTC
jgi:hypothetical protein